MQRPFELSSEALRERLEEMVHVTIDFFNHRPGS
jgi:hypothetical protein